MSFKNLLNRTATLERKVRTSDGQGGFTFNWQEIQRPRVRVRPLSVAERRSADQDQAEITHRLYAGLDFLGERGDRVRIEPFRVGVPEMVLEIDAALETSTRHHVEVNCIERRTDVSSS